MTARQLNGLFVAEGSSDMPIADIVENMFFDRGIELRLRKPDFSLLDRVPKDVRSRLLAGHHLSNGPTDLVVVHRDADNAGWQARREEISRAVSSLQNNPCVIPVIPVRMTEAWLLLSETEIRFVAGNPRGRNPLPLPSPSEVERNSDPKQLLAAALLEAADVAGRRRERLSKRFNQHRRQLLERLDSRGAVSRLPSWQRLTVDIDSAVSQLNSRKTWG
jgi:hypothetical protein